MSTTQRKTPWVAVLLIAIVLVLVGASVISAIGFLIKVGIWVVAILLILFLIGAIFGKDE